MSMISRYQKSGGFVQLVQLIETCGKTKQDNFLQMIEKEDKRWADAVREKILTIEKIFKWDPNTISEIAGSLQELTIATAMHGLKPEDNEKLLRTFTHTQKRNIDDLFKAKAATPAEVSSSFMKILLEVRNMITKGMLHPAKFAPELVIEDGIEEKIGKTVATSKPKEDPMAIEYDESAHSTPHPAHSPHPHGHHPVGATPHPASAAEVTTLRTKLHHMTQENEQLKKEMHILKDKLTQIKKIA